LQRTTRGLLLVGECFLRQVLGVCFIRIVAKKYYTIMVHDYPLFKKVNGRGQGGSKEWIVQYCLPVEEFDLI